MTAEVYFQSGLRLACGDKLGDTPVALDPEHELARLSLPANEARAFILQTAVHPRQPRPTAMFPLPPEVLRNHQLGEVGTSCAAQRNWASRAAPAFPTATFRTYPLESSRFLAGNISRGALRSISTLVWTHFASDSNFSIWRPVWFRLRRVRFINSLREAQRVDERDAEPHVMMAEHLVSRRRWEEAEMEVRIALRKEPCVELVERLAAAQARIPEHF